MIDLKDYGWTAGLEAQTEDITARITAVHKERYQIVSKQGIGYARLKSGVYYHQIAEMAYPTVGDFVLIQYNPSGDSLITETLARRSYFSRKDPDPDIGEQAVAANFDYVFILTSLNQDFSIPRLERYLTVSWASGGTPVIVLTKSDLAEDTEQKLRMAADAAPGVDVFAVSSKTGEGFDALAGYLKPRKTAVLLGSSGVGKSSFVNALAGETLMETKEIREDDSKGRHTTTHRQLFRLPTGVLVIDTPGMRELGMWDAVSGLEGAFADVETLLQSCRFSDCTHQNEPGCAVRRALESGALTADHWKNYCKLRNEAEFAQDKISYQRKRQQLHKSIQKELRQRKPFQKR